MVFIQRNRPNIIKYAIHLSRDKIYHGRIFKNAFSVIMEKAFCFTTAAFL
jgi:hypothetical protein